MFRRPGHGADGNHEVFKPELHTDALPWFPMNDVAVRLSSMRFAVS